MVGRMKQLIVLSRDVFKEKPVVTPPERLSSMHGILAVRKTCSERQLIRYAEKNYGMGPSEYF
jgi:hypothetical protein